jgi:hypothetical protein
MVSRPTQVAVLVSDADDRVLHQLDADPQARQLLRWFQALSPDARAEVYDLARRRVTGPPHASFEVVPFMRAGDTHERPSA